MTADGFERAVHLLEESARADPSFVVARTNAAYARLMRAALGDGPVPSAELDVIRAHLDAALETDPRAPEALALRGAVAALYDLDWPAARTWYRRALDQSPHEVSALAPYAGALSGRGLASQADALFARAIQLDPLNPLARLQRATVPYFARDFAAARERLRDVEELSPGNPLTLYASTVVAIAAGDLEGASDRLQAIAAGWPRVATLPAMLEAAAGRRDRAVDRLRALDPGYGARHPFFLGMAYAWAGEVEQAVHWLTQAISSDDTYAINIPVDPLIDPIRHDPRFRQVWDAMPKWTAGLPYPGLGSRALVEIRAVGLDAPRTLGM